MSTIVKSVRFVTKSGYQKKYKSCEKVEIHIDFDVESHLVKLYDKATSKHFRTISVRKDSVELMDTCFLEDKTASE
jgi:hypothetical protein